MTHRRRCQIESQWHVEVDGVPHIVFQNEEILGDVVVCGYSRRGHAGVLLVDSRRGEILFDVPFCGRGSSRGEPEKVVWMDVSDDARMVCVTSKGFVWSFTCCVDSQGGVDVTGVENVESSDVMLRALEDSSMEGLVMEALSSTQDEGNGVVVVVGGKEEQKEEQQGPECIRERGYRGPKAGYTYWSDKGGYYRNDYVKRSLQEMVRAPLMEQTHVENSADNGDTCVYKGLIRCFVRLPKTSQFVMTSCSPDDGLVYIGRFQDGGMDVACERELVGHLSGVLVLAVSPDGAYVASGSYDQTIRIWDTDTWNCVKVLKGHGGGIKCLEFSRDGSVLFSAASDNTIRVWSTSTWMCMRHLHGRHEDATWPVAMALHEAEDDSLRFLVSGSNGLFGGSTLKVFDIASGDCLATFAQLRYDHKGSCSAVCIMHGRRLITAATDKTLAGWDCTFSVEEAKPLFKGGFFK